MNIADFWRKLIKGLYKLKLNIKLNIKTLFSIVILCALLLGSICFYVRSISLCFWGKIPYFIKKSHKSKRRFDSPIYPKVYLEMLFLMNFY